MRGPGAGCWWYELRAREGCRELCPHEEDPRRHRPPDTPDSRGRQQSLDVSLESCANQRGGLQLGRILSLLTREAEVTNKKTATLGPDDLKKMLVCLSLLLTPTCWRSTAWKTRDDEEFSHDLLPACTQTLPQVNPGGGRR